MVRPRAAALPRGTPMRAAQPIPPAISPVRPPHSRRRSALATPHEAPDSRQPPSSHQPRISDRRRGRRKRYGWRYRRADRVRHGACGQSQRMRRVPRMLAAGKCEVVSKSPSIGQWVSPGSTAASTAGSVSISTSPPPAPPASIRPSAENPAAGNATAGTSCMWARSSAAAG